MHVIITPLDYDCNLVTLQCRKGRKPTSLCSPSFLYWWCSDCLHFAVVLCFKSKNFQEKLSETSLLPGYVWVCPAHLSSPR